MKKGNIISESENIAFYFNKFGALQVSDGKKTDLYEEYCVDHNQNDVFMAIVHKNAFAEITFDDPVHKPIVKCCPMDESVDQKDHSASCVVSYTHSAHWENVDFIVSNKRGRIIQESVSTRIIVHKNGTIQVIDEKARTTHFYDDYCVDHNQNDTYIAVVKEIVPKPIRKCCEAGRQACRLQYTITKCCPTSKHREFWEKYNFEVFSKMRKGRIISETESTRLNVLNNGALRIKDLNTKEFKDYSVYCIDFDQDDKFIAVVKEDDHHSFYSIWPEQIIENLPALPLTFYVFFQSLAMICVITTGTLTIWLTAIIPYSNSRACCLGYFGTCLSIGFITDGFWMSSIFRNISNLCYLIAYGWMTVVWIIVAWCSKFEGQIRYKQFIYFFVGVPFISGIFLAFKCFGWTPCHICGGSSGEF